MTNPSFESKRDALPSVCRAPELNALGEQALRSERVRKQSDRARARIEKHCPDAGLAAWFAAGMDTTSSAALAAGAVRAARCRLCGSLNAADGIGLDCDLASGGPC